MSPANQRKALQRKAQIALGIAVICGLFLLETFVAHRTTPSPVSWLVWSLLGSSAVAALCLGAWFSYRASTFVGRTAQE
jgi:hypothetical protein